MQFSQGHARLDDHGTAASRVRNIAVRALTIVASVLTLAGAFVLSVAIFAVALTAMIVVGSWLWWKTRDLRRQLRTAAQDRVHARHPQHNTIEGVVISRSYADEGATGRDQAGRIGFQ